MTAPEEMVIPTSLLSKLKAHRDYPEEPISTVFARVLKSYDDLILTEQELQNVAKGLEDIKAGRIMTHEEVERKLKLYGK